MDKYEFNIKVEQIKKLVNKSDFETAMKIADTVDWKRVRNANLLSMIAQVYEKNEEYQEAKEILLLAFERAPIGKRLLYKLAELALKENSIKEAEDYYREFCDLAPEDPRQHLLRYMILREKKAPLDQLIHSLERYTNTELDEKWLYELAELYGLAGRDQDCVRTCDKIMLMFGIGKYVDKALELKVQYAPLTDYQMDLLENRHKYEERLRAVEQQYSSGLGGLSDLDVEEEYEEEFPHQTIEEELVASIHQAETEEQLAEEMSKISIEEYHEPESPLGQTKILADIKNIPPVEAMTAATSEMIEEEELESETTDRVEAIFEDETEVEETEIEEAAIEETTEVVEAGLEFEDMPVSIGNHLMIEARTSEKGLELAIEALKKIHQEIGTKNLVVKISGEKLSKRGVFAVADKLAGKDLVIEEAGDLSVDAIEELQTLIEEDESGMIVVLIDNPRQMEELHQNNPEFASLFECIGVQGNQDLDIEEAISRQIEIEEKIAKEISAPKAAPVISDEKKMAPVRQVQEEVNPDYDEEMDLDEFAEHACKYASGIDCSITGKSMLALYERIEIMEEDGIPLTKANAEDLIEEAADKAEKPSFAKMITGVFSSKYDKDGLLILKEEHFIG